jgi:hypothetical protein
MINTTKIYLVTNIDNSPNKVYIGKTKNSRKREHKKKFGSQTQYSYIDEVNSLLSKDWKPLECYWIEQFKSWGFEVLNKNQGGGGASFQSLSTKKKMSISHLGKKLSQEHRNNISKSNKGRIGALKGTKFSKETKIKIGDSKKGNKYNLGKKHSPEHIQKFIENTDWVSMGKKVTKSKKGKPQLNLRKPIFQLDKKGNVIKEWSGQKQASIELNIDQASIWQVLNNKLKSAGGYIWQYKN